MLVEALLPASGFDPETVRETVDEVLSRPEYEVEGPSLLERAVEWVFERLGDAFGGRVPVSDGGAGGGGGLSAVVGWLILIGLVALVVWMLVRTFRGHERIRREEEVDEGDEALRPATEWHAEADAHERAGRWREAVRCRWRAVVAELAGRGVVQEIPGRTAGDYQAEVQRQAPVAGPPFTEVTRLFQGAWYGGLPTGPEDADRARALVEDTLTTAGRA